MHEQEVAYKLYISDFLFYYGKGMTLQQRYKEIVFDRKKTDKRTADEVVKDIIAKAGLHVGKE